ncbi:protein FAR1-RELATED SEQUENCE 5-like isoform X5 [Primulina eburnea]|uniref:protein FAR1-RELATED SEQUENCE 5-like isoform X5 n=1 Tax=Primulina eburnea TaxID=1245227 RepID=UPI003C6BD8FA
MENEAQTGIEEGQNLNSIVIVCIDEDDIEINQDKTPDAVAIIEQNVPVPANEEDTMDCVDVSGFLVGMTRETIDDMHQLYCKHARALGFSVRKSTTRCYSNEVVVEKYFVCSCAGVKNSGNADIFSDASSSRKRSNSCLTRTGCKASLRVKLNDDGVYEVLSHVMEHNHPFTRTEWGHLHRSERTITKEKGKAIEDMITSGMRSSDSFRYMVQDARGEENVGHTMKDHMNFVNRMKMNAIEGGDAQTVIEMLQEEDTKEEDFYFKVKLDDEGRLCNVYWRDSMMKEDYRIYGDVMVFDTTYRTNKYNLICAPFIGINNHWNNAMFGCAFLANEKYESFQWLFEVFKKSMGGKCPITLFTDQDQAIATAIEKATIKHWRIKEQNNEFQCSKSVPESVLPMTGMLKHASEVYTLTLFREFESEFLKSISTCSTIVLVEDSMMVYDVSSHDANACTHRVVFDCLRNMITCSCKKFEECGFLCYHCLRVLHINSVVSIPEFYIQKRWTKFAKSEIWDRLNNRIERSEKAEDCIPWRHEMARKYYNLVLKSQGNEEARRIVEEGYNRDTLSVDTLMTSLSSTEQSETSVHSYSSNVVRDPARSITKGRSQRIKGHFHKKKKKRTVESNLIPAKEFGSKTPNVHLF